jgi:hypothetical protein
MIITIDLSELGPNSLLVESNADDVHEVTSDFYDILTSLFPEDCVEHAFLTKAKELLEAKGIEVPDEEEEEDETNQLESKFIIARLLAILYEEVHANGGSCISPDSELWLRQLADEINPASALELIDQLREHHA